MTTVDSSLPQCAGRGPEPISERRLAANPRSWNDLRYFVRDSWLARVALGAIVALAVLAGLQLLGAFESFAAWPFLRNVSGWVGPAAVAGAAGAAVAAAAAGTGDPYPGFQGGGGGEFGDGRNTISGPDNVGGVGDGAVGGYPAFNDGRNTIGGP